MRSFARSRNPRQCRRCVRPRPNCTTVFADPFASSPTRSGQCTLIPRGAPNGETRTRTGDTTIFRAPWNSSISRQTARIWATIAGPLRARSTARFGWIRGVLDLSPGLSPFSASRRRGVSGSRQAGENAPVALVERDATFAPRAKGQRLKRGPTARGLRRFRDPRFLAGL